MLHTAPQCIDTCADTRHTITVHGKTKPQITDNTNIPCPCSSCAYTAPYRVKDLTSSLPQPARITSEEQDGRLQWGPTKQGWAVGDGPWGNGANGGAHGEGRREERGSETQSGDDSDIVAPPSRSLSSFAPGGAFATEESESESFRPTRTPATHSSPYTFVSMHIVTCGHLHVQYRPAPAAASIMAVVHWSRPDTQNHDTRVVVVVGAYRGDGASARD
jgi:hypothetical protein